MTRSPSCTSGPQNARGMAGLSRTFYEVAYEFTLSMSKGELSAFIKYPSAVVILLQSCLEAYINEFLAVHRQMDVQKWGAAISQLDRISLPEKWFRAPLIFSSKTFDKGAEPYQSFSLLVSLRNHLVHYDPRFRTPLEFPSKKVRSLKAKFTFSYEGRADWTTQVLNLECARWGCQTVKAMVRKFHEFVGGIDMSSWPYPWPDPP